MRPVPANRPVSPGQHLLVAVATGVVFAALAWAGIGLTREEGRIAALWFPNALLLLVMLRLHPSCRAPAWLAALAGNVAVNLAWHDPLAQALGLGLCNLAEVALALWAMRTFKCDPPDFADNRHILTFAAIALGCAGVSALLAVIVLHPPSVQEAVALWWQWTRADALGLVLLVPAVTIMADGWRRRRALTWRKLGEGAALLVLGSTLSIYTFWQTSYPFLFLDAPIVLLYAIRLGPVGNALAIVNLAVVASVATVLDRGPIHLVQGGTGDKLLVLQLFLATSFAIGLPVASLVRRLQEAAREKADFLASMSHDIRTPMNAVLGFAELLRRAVLPEEQRRHVDQLVAGGQTMVRLLDDILDFSRLEAGRLKLVSSALPLHRELTQCLAIFEPRATEKGLRLHLSIAPEVPQLVDGDALRLRQILTNLVGNAIKFTDRGSVTLSARMREGLGSGWLEIGIADTGIGIPPDQRAGIFARYSQAAHTGQTGCDARGGAGLGLAICRQLAELMGGRIELTASSPRGSVFTLLLPVRENADSMQPTGALSWPPKVVPGACQSPI